MGPPSSPALPSITDMPPASWTEEEVAPYGADGFYSVDPSYEMTYSAQNPTPGTGRTGFLRVPPNNYPFYSADERYTPIVQPDGGQLSEWQPMYNPSKEQAETDRAKAYEARVPHGYTAPGDKYKGLPTIDLWVQSDLHDASEYGGNKDAATGRHSGGPVQIRVSPKMRIEELRLIIRDQAGIIPALQKLSYAGKHMDDSQRTLEHYGVAYWHQKFPHWPIKIRQF